MEIFEFAIEREKQAEQIYRQLAKDADDPGTKHIFEMLAGEEVHHVEVIKQLESESSEQVRHVDVISNAQQILDKMKASAKNFKFDVKQVEIYKKARDIEEKSEAFYKQKRDELKKQEQKEVFGKLATEEHKHYLLLDNIIQFVLQPERWLENAEFFHLEEY
jgi:rubrerythrin